MVGRSIAVAIVLGLAGLYAARIDAVRPASENTPALTALPAQVGGWTSEDLPVSESTRDVLAADAMLMRRYHRADGSTVWLFLAYFARQQVNSQIHSPRHCLPGSGWSIDFLDQTAVPLAGRTILAARMRAHTSEVSQDVVYWFRTRSGFTASDYALKWDLVKNSLAGRPTSATFVRFNAETADSAALREVMIQLAEPLEQLLAEDPSR